MISKYLLMINSDQEQALIDVMPLLEPDSNGQTQVDLRQVLAHINPYSFNLDLFWSKYQQVPDSYAYDLILMYLHQSGHPDLSDGPFNWKPSGLAILR